MKKITLDDDIINFVREFQGVKLYHIYQYFSEYGKGLVELTMKELFYDNKLFCLDDNDHMINKPIIEQIPYGTTISLLNRLGYPSYKWNQNGKHSIS